MWRLYARLYILGMVMPGDCLPVQVYVGRGRKYTCMYLSAAVDLRNDVAECSVPLTRSHDPATLGSMISVIYCSSQSGARRSVRSGNRQR
ncbi:hypothetical protein EDC04DRAFT_2664625 [Pisolithus marmoratus]|nr:hypothetical protein EDC04DRAFT_2664625 [Pisolithus marmoratus]